MARTVAAIIAAVDDVCPNSFTDEWKAAKLAALDGDIWLNVLVGDDAELFDYKMPDDANAAVLVGMPFDTIYDLHLKAQIEFANGEYEKYNNTSAYFEAEFRRFKAWFLNTYHPAQGYYVPIRGAIANG
ncbi:MAG: hypothetical protein LBJ99_01505 [Oscillospiraceae bacterium]|jgi:hypothetical protein|nr:hypothetical protein [Oscillospiraceae bacterium]